MCVCLLEASTAALEMANKDMKEMDVRGRTAEASIVHQALCRLGLHDGSGRLVCRRSLRKKLDGITALHGSTGS